MSIKFSQAFKVQLKYQVRIVNFLWLTQELKNENYFICCSRYYFSINNSKCISQ